MIPTINVGNLDSRDKQTAVWMIGLENSRRLGETPPETPLPTATNAEIKDSYEKVLIPILISAHNSYIQQEAQANGPDKVEFKVAFANANPQQRTAALAALTTS